MRSTHVLMSETLDEQVILYKDALERIGISNYTFVNTGDEVIDYLQAKGQFADREKFPFPDWLLLDVRTPRRNGFEVLEWLYRHQQCRVIPTVLFSTSEADEEVRRAYEWGVNAYFVKPSGIRELTETLALIDHFWRIALSPIVTPTMRCDDSGSIV